jgi:hypothetical protein
MMHSRSNRIAVAIAMLTTCRVLAQGELQPSGAPEPTMRSLGEIHDCAAEAAWRTGIATNALGNLQGVHILPWPDHPIVRANANLEAVTNAFLSVNWPALERACRDLSGLNDTFGDWTDVRTIRDMVIGIDEVLAGLLNGHVVTNALCGHAVLERQITNLFTATSIMSAQLGGIAEETSAVSDMAGDNNAMLRQLTEDRHPAAGR